MVGDTYLLIRTVGVIHEVASAANLSMSQLLAFKKRNRQEKNLWHPQISEVYTRAKAGCLDMNGTERSFKNTLCPQFDPVAILNCTTVYLWGRKKWHREKGDIKRTAWVWWIGIRADGQRGRAGAATLNQQPWKIDELLIRLPAVPVAINPSETMFDCTLNGQWALAHEYTHKTHTAIRFKSKSLSK